MRRNQEGDVADINSQDSRVDACEVVVVGAGLIGATIATSLADEGLDVAVLEARGVASGATGRTAGLVCSGLPLPYAQAVERYGRETTRALWRLTADNRARVAEAAGRLDVPVERTGSLLLATDAQQGSLLRASAEMLGADGFEFRFEATDPLKKGFTAALHSPDDLVVDAVTLTRRLLSAFEIPIHTNTEVYGLEQAGDDVLVLAHGRAVRAGTVVLAINAYAPLLDGYFADKIAPARSHTLMTRPLSERLMVRAGSTGSFSFRQDNDGRLLFAACQPAYETPAATPRDENSEIDLARFIGRHFPEATERLAQRGSGTLGVSRDGLPLLGALPHLPQVFFAVGFGGHGLSLTFSAADLMMGLILGGAEPELFSARRME